MSQSMTFDSLSEDIKKYCERTDPYFLEQIPRFIMLAENRIGSETKPLGFLRVVSGKMTSPVLEKPIRWRKTKNLFLNYLGKWTPVFKRSYEYCRTYWPDSTLTSQPMYYADYDYEHFLIVPNPPGSVDFELQYYEKIQPLDPLNQTNWTTQYAPQLILYASLIEAMPFVKTPEKIKDYQSLYDRALMAIVNESQDGLTDSST